ncbi:hypothetical protein EV672_101122 [Aquabacterium commune]|uniref:DUF2486 family protein n=1 Tax=Aquabacterium commune TaxID=70586 RepID=A0A4R6RPG4_9BURK|nr:hypothetical protein [Aquabacterium commune]TDP87987.1 hypothetical protein EV672_101122 [Aquabacterium commune]
MNTFSRPHPAHVPTLTEVIEVAELAPSPTPAAPQPIPLDSLPVLEGQLAQRVLNDVQRQIDSMLEFRLREAMAPVLARHSEAIVRELKDELARTMRDVVARSVAQEVAKLRPR